MRATVFFLMLGIIQVSAINSYSQQSISIKLTNVSLSDVLNEIEERSDFYFLYNQDLIDVNRKVSLNAENESIDKILNQLFSQSGIEYVIKDRQIILTSLNGYLQSAQQKEVRGKVTDSNGQPLPGVAVVIKETTNGIITDADGNYILNKVPSDATLVFSFVGMKMQEISVAGKTMIDVVMQEETIGIEEVVAIGYGTESKKKLTTSVAKFKAGQMEELPITNIADAFSGQISGVLAENGVGTPGSSPVIRIRGYGSINAGSEPLYVIDGMMANATQFGALNPKSIESVDILKDAAAGAIYGSRAGNGVILVTTKKGKSGKV